MIARFQILLPYLMLVAPDNAPEPIDLVRDGVTMRVYPPYKATLDPQSLEMESSVALEELPPGLEPANPQPLSPNNEMDGMPVVVANALQIDVVADSFDRTREAPDDPPPEIVFDTANEFLLKLRHLARAHQIKPVSQYGTVWRMTYLNDNKTELEPAEGLYRTRSGVSFSISFLGLPPGLWSTAAAMPPEYAPEPSASLLLDAFSLLPERGPALVLAYSAIETRIDSALEILSASAGLDPQLWEWITERGDQFHKQPSFTERLDQLLRGVSGVSLKDDAGLWQAFQDLRKARNSFAHEGVPIIGGIEVDDARTRELLNSANAIIDWIEGLLPEDRCRPPENPWATVQSTRIFTAPVAPPSDVTGLPADDPDKEA